jgi:diguanylate cyclase (GGDEF)-like protein
VFQERIDALTTKQSDRHKFAVLCLDLDRFKEVNDTLGHPAGDELLRLVAGRLRKCVRDGDLVARLGGDEFAIILEGGSDLPVRSLASRLIKSISAPYQLQGNQTVIGTSIGVVMSDPGLSGLELLKRADLALYKAKEDRGSFVFFEPGMDEHLQARRQLEADLRIAVLHNEFVLHYQPLFNLAEDRVTGFEALIRWISPSRGFVAPDQFIPIAEQTGLIAPIGEWVLETACADATQWPDQVRVCVNLSAMQIKNKRLLPLVKETLAITGLPARRLELEITETVLLQDTDAVIATLKSLRAMDVRISMDDFGTGYSSLSYLRRFQFDKLKIDRSFVSDLRGTNSQDATGPLAASERSAATIIRAIVGLGENLGMSTTAEGVETAEQFTQVRAIGCTEVQGYFISPPKPASEIPAMLDCLPNPSQPTAEPANPRRQHAQAQEAETGSRPSRQHEPSSPIAA